MHAVSFVMGFSLPLWLGLEPGRKLNPSPRLAFGISFIYAEVNCGYPEKEARTAVNRRSPRRRAGAPRARRVQSIGCLDRDRRPRHDTPASHPPAGRDRAEGES